EDEDDDVWNIERLRQETEKIRSKKEEDRLAAANGDETPAEDTPTETPAEAASGS
ncbi:hypothetical protein F66182_10573, partial [Fusarium sp. NRRL 66182]